MHVCMYVELEGCVKLACCFVCTVLEGASIQ